MIQHRVDGDADRALKEALCQGGDVEGTFHQLFRRYHRRLLGFFSRRGFPLEICHDLSQETFLRVYRSRGRFRGEVPLTGWIFQIAANVYRNELRRSQAEKRAGQEMSLDDDAQSDLTEAHTGGDPAPATAVSEPLARALGREQVEALRRALDALPTQMRRATQLRVYHDYDVEEIAAVMKISPSTVKVHLHQARKRLRRDLEDRFGELPF